MPINRIERTDPFVFPELDMPDAPVKIKKNNDYYKDSIKPFDEMALHQALITQTGLANSLGKIYMLEIAKTIKTTQVVRKERIEIEDKNINLAKVGKVFGTVQNVAGGVLIGAGILGFILTCFLGFGIPAAVAAVAGAIAAAVKAGSMVTNGAIEHKVNLGKADIVPLTEKERINNEKNKAMNDEIARTNKQNNDIFAASTEQERKKKNIQQQIIRS